MVTVLTRLRLLYTGRSPKSSAWMMIAARGLQRGTSKSGEWIQVVPFMSLLIFKYLEYLKPLPKVRKEVSFEANGNIISGFPPKTKTEVNFGL